ncbi:hypothetical protein R1flu_022525 [Riccia fluitans]|uniref:Uncharacterized protein n=1 Tax=Riccia fluitans TaxID=41844 RepID=A0ABD1XQ42_9MARC
MQVMQQQAHLAKLELGPKCPTVLEQQGSGTDSARQAEGPGARSSHPRRRMIPQGARTGGDDLSLDEDSDFDNDDWSQESSLTKDEDETPARYRRKAMILKSEKPPT